MEKSKDYTSLLLEVLKDYKVQSDFMLDTISEIKKENERLKLDLEAEKQNNSVKELGVMVLVDGFVSSLGIKNLPHSQVAASYGKDSYVYKFFSFCKANEHLLDKKEV